MLKLPIYLVIGFLSASCTSPESDRFAYVERVASVLGTDAVTTQVALTPTPSERSLRLEIAEHKINPLQFADLHRCDMGDLVGERNSGLGRFAPASQRMGYEIRWLCRARGCELEWLEELAGAKRTSLPKLYWNATIAGPEFSSLLRQDGGDVDLSMLVLLELSMPEDCDFQQVEFEQTLNQVQRSGGIKGRRAEWALFREALTNVTSVLQGLNRPLCLNDGPTAKAERLFAVFRRYYVEDLQPKMSAALRKDREWVEALHDFDRSFGDVAPEVWSTFYSRTLNPESDHSEWQATHQAIVTHSQAWQHIFHQCGVDIRSVVGQRES